MKNLKQKECEKSPNGKHFYETHSQLLVNERVGMIEGTKMCKYCNSEIKDSLYELINNKPSEEWYRRKNVLLAILTILIMIIIAIIDKI